MQPNLFPVAAIGWCLAGMAQLSAQVSAQIQEESPAPVPRVLFVEREQIKEGREAAHVKAEEAWPRIFQKGNVTTHYVGMTAETGASEAWFLEPYDSFGAMEKARAEMLVGGVLGVPQRPQLSPGGGHVVFAEVPPYGGDRAAHQVWP